MNQVLCHPKIKPEHLARRAIVYLRQSSEKQVRQNKESQRLQYDVAERMRGLGWKAVEIIANDLGSSAGMASARREGFERVLSSVALGEVGIVGSWEVSRLSRTDKDWCRLLEVCQIFGTLIADEQHIYDLNSLDDQLVLGIKGTLSVVELKILRQRMQAGQESKARRGELFKRLPVGFVLDAMNKVAFHPDRRVSEALQLVFLKFRERWSVRQTFQWFRDHDVELHANPRRCAGMRAACSRNSCDAEVPPASSFAMGSQGTPFLVSYTIPLTQPVSLVTASVASAARAASSKRRCNRRLEFARSSILFTTSSFWLAGFIFRSYWSRSRRCKPLLHLRIISIVVTEAYSSMPQATSRSHASSFQRLPSTQAVMVVTVALDSADLLP